ncbi:MAG: FmdB family zinc ribbon protein [Acidobacteriota bacterium]
MPIYEYKCSRCGYFFEVFQKINQPTPPCCPRCGGPIRKQLSPPAIQFKGTGWYVTDYAGTKNLKKPDKKDEKPIQKKTKEDTSSPSSSSNHKPPVPGT